MLRVHRLADFAAERLAELLDVLHRAVRAPLAGAVRVRLRQHARRLLGLVLTPHLAEADEEALRRSVAVDFRGLRDVLLGHHLLQRLVGDVNATVIGRVFAQRGDAVQLLAGCDLKAGVLVRQALLALVELLLVLGREPAALAAVGVVLHIAGRPILRALVVEAVRHLVSDHDTRCRRS